MRRQTFLRVATVLLLLMVPAAAVPAAEPTDVVGTWRGTAEEVSSPHIQGRVLAEARALLERAQVQCRAVLEQHADVLQALTAALLKDETVSGALLRELLPLNEESNVTTLPMLKAATSALDSLPA